MEQKCATKGATEVSNTWTPQSWEEAVLRAAGRRRYNSVRRVLAELRRHELIAFWKEHPYTPGWKAQAARALGVHRSTITRDMGVLLRRVNESKHCPLCGHWS